ncbi:peptidase domain-containing ABC transporter [Pseudoduganella rivuli]|nr:peptidase domain-containing ABC transporter [Pseudoduganella rivuli]
MQLNFSIARKLPFILQTEASECGLACIAMIASYLGHHVDLPEMRKRFPVSLKGTTLAQLIAISEQLGMYTRALRVDLDELAQVQTPAVLHWNLNHFVVLKAVRGEWATVHDPAVGDVRISMKDVSRHFTGVVLELTPGMTFTRKARQPPIPLSQLVGNLVGLKRSLVHLLVLAVVLEAVAMVMPVLSEWIMDGAIVSADTHLLTLLGMGLVLLGTTNATIGVLRSWIGLYISTTFNLQWMSNVMGHLLKLPVSYFERRHLGDIVSRFGAVHAIEQTLTNSAVEAVLDGLLALGTFVMMTIYSPKLAAVTLSAVVLYGIWRWARFGALRMAQMGVIAKNAKEQTYFLETIRGVRSIKLSNREQARRNNWMNLWVDATNANLGTQKLNLMFNVSWSYLATLERAAVLWLGASAVIEHAMSLGMLFAFLTYKEQFSSRVNLLIDRVIDFRMLHLQAERLGDILLTAPEESHAYRKHDIPDDLTLTLDNITYGYSDDESILDGVSLEIRPGECVAITGASGSGKSTCFKIMLGILAPVAGQVKLGGINLSHISHAQYRSLIGTVMQDDQLFAGTVFDNISFMDEKPVEAWVKECAVIAGVHDEINTMPMGYHTLIGDMGTALSGGQQQRILLARALYRRPKILFLDEATSHLDIENEARIGKAISELKISRVMIAHRPQTIAIADRVLSLQNGKLIAVPKAAVAQAPALQVGHA